MSDKKETARLKEMMKRAGAIKASGSTCADCGKKMTILYFKNGNKKTIHHGKYVDTPKTKCE